MDDTPQKGKQITSQKELEQALQFFDSNYHGIYQEYLQGKEALIAIQRDVADKKQILEDFLKENNLLENNYLKIKLSTFGEMIDVIKYEFNRNKGKISEQTDLIYNLKEDVQSGKQELHIQSSKFDIRENQYNGEVEEVCKELGKQIEDQKINYEEQLMEKIKEIKLQEEKFKREISYRFTDANLDKQVLNKQIEELNEQIQNYKKIIDDQADKINQGHEKSQNLELLIQKQNKDFEKQTKSIKAEFEEKKIQEQLKVNKMEQRVRDKDEEIRITEERMEAVNLQCEDIKDQYKKMVEQLEGFKQLIQEKENQIENNKQIHAILESKLNTQKGQIENEKELVQQAQDERDQIKKEIGS